MKQEKQYLLDEIKEQITQSNAFVITQYGKLTAVMANEFRRELQSAGGHFEVVRKRVFMKALEQAGLSFDLDGLTGHVGIVFAGSDPIEATKAIIRYSDKNDKILQLLGGHFDGQMVGSEDMQKIATLPGRDQMRSELLGLFEAPMAQTLSVMEALLCSVLHCMENKGAEEQN